MPLLRGEDGDTLAVAVEDTTVVVDVAVVVMGEVNATRRFGGDLAGDGDDGDDGDSLA